MPKQLCRFCSTNSAVARCLALRECYVHALAQGWNALDAAAVEQVSQQIEGGNQTLARLADYLACVMQNGTSGGNRYWHEPFALGSAGAACGAFPGHRRRKWLLPIAPMAEQSHLPGAFLRFIGACEILGAVGLILPQRLKILPVLTPIAAIGLMIIVIGATVTTIMAGQGAVALLPAATAALCAFVAWGRWRLKP